MMKVPTPRNREIWAGTSGGRSPLGRLATTPLASPGAVVLGAGGRAAVGLAPHGRHDISEQYRQERTDRHHRGDGHPVDLDHRVFLHFSADIGGSPPPLLLP